MLRSRFLVAGTFCALIGTLALAGASSPAHANIPAAVAPPDNVIVHWSFEAASPFNDSSSSTNRTVTRASVGTLTAPNGTTILKVAAANSTNATKTVTRQIANATVKDETYTAKVWLRNGNTGAAGRSATVSVTEVNSAGATVGSANKQIVLDSSWTAIQVSYTAVAGADSLLFSIVDPANADKDRSYWADVATLVDPAGVPCPYDKTLRETDPNCLKPVLRGLVNTLPTKDHVSEQTGNPDYENFASSTRRLAAVLAPAGRQQFATIKIDWSALQPTETDLPKWWKINEIMADFPQVRFRLRIAAGIRTPDWVNDKVGPCLVVTSAEMAAASHGGCIPQFWTAAFLGEYRQLMDKVAAKYDGNAQVVEVVNSACSTAYSEPFILGIASKDRRADLESAAYGSYTKAKHEQCIRDSSVVMADAFDHTRFSVALHKRWEWTGSGGVMYAGTPAGEDPQLYALHEMERVANSLRATYGNQLVVDEHGVKLDSDCQAGVESVYCYLQAFPDDADATAANPSTRFGFQFNGAVDQSTAGIERAAGWGASNFEWAWFDWITSDAEVLRLHDLLASN